MNTAHGQRASAPPRALVRAFWAIHKSIVRFSGGRIGLWRPRADKRFGVMALETVGRRSGREHSVILGYFTEGPDLITLAMNGWADSEPAWWLNLQAQPDVTVRLPTGPRAVHARAAEGDERTRLWARVDDYPGWGDNIDELATRRSMNTTVVIFEPRTAL